MFDKVVEVILKNTSITRDKINRDSCFVTDLSINSFEMTEMICELEDTLGIEIPEEAIKNFRTVGNIVDYLEKTQ
ncbi:MAG: acyl carrier protein [Bacillota bacterium]|jgi:acyl carrier protein